MTVPPASGPPSAPAHATKAKRNRPWYKKWWVWVVAFLVFFVTVGLWGQTLPKRAESSPSAAPASSTAAPSVTGTETPTPTPTPTPTSTPLPTKPAEPSAAPTEAPPEAASLGEQTEAALLNAWGVDSLQSIPSDLRGATAITEFEDVSSDTVRVYVQENLSKSDRDALARMIHGLVTADVPNLDTLVVRDASGVDSNHFY